jgi:hypothetical protein
MVRGQLLVCTVYIVCCFDAVARLLPGQVALLADQDLNLRREAMFSMLRYTKSNPQNIVKCVEAGVLAPHLTVRRATLLMKGCGAGAVKLLVPLMRHEDTVLRRNACKLAGYCTCMPLPAAL